MKSGMLLMQEASVAALVYIAALAPAQDEGETSQSQLDQFPASDVFSRIEVAEGRIWLLPSGVECFAGDLSEQKQQLVWATHFPPAADLLSRNEPGTAWRSKPSWYIVAAKDRTVQPELQRFVAKRMGATTYEIDSSHVPMLSHPDLVLDVIRSSAPEELLTTGASYWPAALQQAVADPLTFNQVVAVLLQFSLVKRMSKYHQLSIHRLVQIVQMESMEPQQQLQWAERVVRAVNAVFPADPRENSAVWSQCLRYLEQAQTCTLLIQQHHLQFPDAADLLERTGIYLYERILYSLAEPLFLEALRLWERQGELDHAHIVSSLSNLTK